MASPSLDSLSQSDAFAQIENPWRTKVHYITALDPGKPKFGCLKFSASVYCISRSNRSDETRSRFPRRFSRSNHFACSTNEPVRLHSCVHGFACMHDSAGMHDSVGAHDSFIEKHICASMHACMQDCMHECLVE
jgi:hypothetical protein